MFQRSTIMRVLFIIAVAVSTLGFGGCAGGKAYIDLRKPIYLVTEDSFFAGCEKDPAGTSVCRESRSQVVRAGVMQWFDYLEEDTRPFVGIVSDRSLVPHGTNNQPIHIKAGSGVCDEKVGDKPTLACYYGGDYSSGPYINFVDTTLDHIAVHVMAHEFGHALLGSEHYDNADGSSSIMSASVPPGGSVASTDIDRLYRIHKECPKRKRVGKVDKDKK